MEGAKIDGQKSTMKKPWPSEEMSAIERCFEMNIKSHVVPRKKNGKKLRKKNFHCCKSKLGF